MTDETTEPEDIPIPGRPGTFNVFEDRVQEQVDAARLDQAGLSREDIATHYAKTFGTRSGRIVFEDLLRFAFGHSGFDPSLGFYNGAAYGFYRSGMGDLVNHINRMKAGGSRGKT